jgi:hypothetical protein
MIGRSAASVQTMSNLIAEWARDIGVDSGFVDERVLQGSDGQFVVCVRFTDRAAYEALADNPKQAAWWATVMEPILEGEPNWIDGEWHDLWAPA